jgi:nucleotide-binding universal stress UspA family protein
MKMLVCTDGSEHSQKAVEKAAKIAANFKEVEVYIIYVNDCCEGN